MSAPHFNQSLDDMPDHVHVARSLDELDAIKDSETNLAIFPRTLDPLLWEYLASLVSNDLPHNESYSRESFREAFSSPDSAEAEQFVQMITDQNDNFERIANELGRTTRVHSKYSSGNPYGRDFHTTDGFMIRQIWSFPYGMHWIANDHAKEVEGKSPSQLTSLIQRGLIRQLKPGWVAAFKGTDRCGQRYDSPLSHAEPTYPDSRFTLFSDTTSYSRRAAIDAKHTYRLWTPV